MTDWKKQWKVLAQYLGHFLIWIFVAEIVTQELKMVGVEIYTNRLYIRPEYRLWVVLGVLLSSAVLAISLFYYYKRFTHVMVKKWKMSDGVFLIGMLVLNLLLSNLFFNYLPAMVEGKTLYPFRWWTDPFAGMLNLNRSFLVRFLYAFSYVGLAPIFEELSFRGILPGILLQKVPKTGKYILSSLIFAMAHYSNGISGFVLMGLFVNGLIAYSLYCRRNSFIEPMIFHSVHNGLLVLIYNLLM